jgi:protein-tyrosine-phosphatase
MAHGSMPAILFVCTANRLRSPMAAALFRARLARMDAAQNWRIESAGTWTRPGFPALPEAQQVMREMGLDLSAHLAREVSAELLAQFDLVLTMQQSHKEALRVEFPQIAGRVWQLNEMAGNNGDVLDPLPLQLDEVRRLAQTIDQALAQGMPRIMTLARQRRGE